VARVSRNGRYALFTTSGSVGGAPNNGHVAIYRYDTQTAELACVSCRPDGSASQGDASLDRMPPAALRDHQPARNITDDGGVVFATRDRLVPEDISDAADVYLYDDGELSLISSGRSAAHNYVADNTDDGRSIFFLTTDSLVPQDTDTGLWDLYVARVSGGFREDGDAAQPCDGDACQGEQPDRPFLEPPQSGPGGEGNTVPEDPPARQRPRRSLSFRLPPALVRRALARGTAQVPVRVSGGGTIRVRATARIRGRTRIVATAVRRVTRTSAITVRVPLRLRAIARRELRRVGRLRVTVEVRMTGVDRPVRRTFTLRRATR
jgi:antitoxin component of MazEF toxin-antitoxin module